MNILIIGCGKLGARLANVLDSQELLKDNKYFKGLEDN